MNALRRQPGGLRARCLADEVDALLGANEDGGPPVSALVRRRGWRVR